MSITILLAASIISLSTTTASPYAHTTITSDVTGPLMYHYNKAGQRLGHQQGDRMSQSIYWDLIDKPARVHTGTVEEQLHYRPGGDRYLRSHKGGSSKTIYIGETKVLVNAGGEVTEQLIFIRNGEYSPIAMVTIDGDNNAWYHYFVNDHLGSSMRAVNDNGTVDTKLSNGRYSAWGDVLAPTGITSQPNDKTRGFTGHDTIVSADLIDMNARLYDPFSSHFLSADKYIQHPGSIVSLNPYAYVANSPLNATDPSGWVKSKIKIRRKIIIPKGIENIGIIQRNLGSVADNLTTSFGKANITQTDFSYRETITPSSKSRSKVKINKFLFDVIFHFKDGKEFTGLWILNLGESEGSKASSSALKDLIEFSKSTLSADDNLKKKVLPKSKGKAVSIKNPTITEVGFSIEDPPNAIAREVERHHATEAGRKAALEAMQKKLAALRLKRAEEK